MIQLLFSFFSGSNVSAITNIILLMLLTNLFFLLQDSQVSDVPKRMGTLRTQTNATNIMTASMVLPRIVYALMV